MLRIFQYIQSYGLQAILPHTKKLSGTPLWEIRILGKDSLRILYVISHKEIILILHAFIKKTQKTPPKEIVIALKRYENFRQRSKITS